MEDLKERINNAVYEVIGVLNEQLDENHRLEKRPDTVLLGKNGKLDSVGFVNFIVLLEDKCGSECGVPVSLTDALETIVEPNPFHTVRSLVDYLYQIVRGAVLQGN
jgi:acyl carrier protein